MTHHNFIGGQWIGSRGGATFADETPAHRGSSLGSFQSSTADDVACAIDAAAGAFPSWRRTPIADRQRPIAAFLHLLKESREEIAQIVQPGNGKTNREVRRESGSRVVGGSYHLQKAPGFFGAPARRS